VRYFEHAGHVNLGKATSRNVGLANARGELVAFLDADDVFLADKLHHQAALLARHSDVDAVYGRTLYWSSWQHGTDTRADRPSRLGIAAGTIVDPPRLLTAFLRNGGIIPCLCAPLIRRDAVERVGRFDESIQHMYEDQVLLAKLCLHSRVLVDDVCCEKYRQHDRSTSNDAIRDGHYHPWKLNDSERAYLDWLAGYIGHQGIQDRELQRALAASRRPYDHPRFYSIVRHVTYRAKRLGEILLPTQ
jgi:glycosyltransferase involved in cell wall biosynthesis